MNKRFFNILSLIALVLPVVCMADVPVPGVPPGHPRVYLRSADVNDIRAKILLLEFQSDWNTIKSNANSEAVSAALVYLVEGDTTKGRWAIGQAMTAIQACTDGRTFDSAMHWAACVYDWCYDLLTPSEKAGFVTEFQRVANLNAPYYPAQLTANPVVGHTAEGWLLTGQLPAGIAIYDENGVMYDAAAQLFFQKYISPRNFHYPSHAYHQGDSYLSRFAHDIASAWLFRRIGAGDVYSSEQQYMPYCAIYNQRPDGQQMRRGDTYDSTGISGSKYPIFMMTGTYYEEPYVMAMADDPRFTKYTSWQILRPMHMIFRKPNLPKSPFKELPLTKYFAAPMGEMVARTGWDINSTSSDAVVFMRIGGTFYSGHQRRDMGTFQIYYKGPLAICTGIYQSSDPCYPTEYGSDHWKNYYHQTLAHNGLLIFDPCEVLDSPTFRSANDGGQRMPNGGVNPNADTVQSSTYRLGEVTGRQFGPDSFTPEYSYISGNITNAYTSKVSEVTRSMVTLNLDDSNYPCSLITFDRITSANATFKKTWLVHSIQEPQIAGRKITILRNEGNYSGKLITESLLPASVTITKVGGPGYQFWVQAVGTNYMVVPDNADEEPGAWRVEVSPSVNQLQDFFLHVMTVTDVAVPNGPAIESVLDSDDEVVGVRLLDRTVVFGKYNTPLITATFKIPGSGTAKILVCDLQEGFWSVSRAGVTVTTGLEATEQGRCIYFTGPAGLDGEYLLTVADPDFDSDGGVDLKDFYFLADQWLLDNPQVNPATGKSPDLYGDGMIDFADFALFGKKWLQGTAMPQPRALYKFEGNYNNSMGGPPGTPAGSATIVYDSDRDSNVLNLSSSNSYVRFTNSPVLGIDIAITIACWVKASSLSSDASLVTKGYAWRTAGNSGPARFTTPDNVLNGTVNVSNNTWRHVAAVYDGSRKYLYIDGVLDTYADSSETLSTWEGYIFAAGALLKEYGDGTPYAGFPKFFFNGRLDNVCIYDIALTPMQISKLAGE